MYNNTLGSQHAHSNSPMEDKDSCQTLGRIVFWLLWAVEIYIYIILLRIFIYWFYGIKTYQVSIFSYLLKVTDYISNYLDRSLPALNLSGVNLTIVIFLISLLVIMHLVRSFRCHNNL